jgi:hypothetical protein
MVDFEEWNAAEFFQAVGTAVETRAEQERLARAAANRLAHEVVDEARAHHCRTARARPAEVKEVRCQAAYGGQARECGQRFEAAGEERGGVGVVEQAAAARFGGSTARNSAMYSAVRLG